MNQVSSFLENIIAVENSQTTNLERDHPVRPSEWSRRSTQDLDIPSISERAKNPKDVTGRAGFAGVRDLEESTLSNEDVLDAPNQAKVSDFWYLEDDQKKVSNQLTDRLMEKVLSVMLSTELKPDLDRDPRNFVHKTRPPLLVHLMSINTTQMAQKASPVFEFLDEVAFSMGWYNPWHTTGITMLATVLILRPYLLATLPALMLLKKYLIPSYERLYPPDPSVIDNMYIFDNPLLHAGAPLRKYEPPKQISQFSREFVTNFTDLQNHMVIYIRLYDFLVDWGQHYFFFQDQRLSSVIFLVLLSTIVINLLALPHIMPFFFKVIPVKALMLVVVWLVAILLHPFVSRKVLESFDTEEARDSCRDRTDRIENSLIKAIAEDEETSNEVVKEVEVFELHTLSANKIWEPIGYTSDFFALNHPQRRLNDLSSNIDNPVLEPVLSPSSTESACDRAAGGVEESVCNISRKVTLAEITLPKYWRFAEKQWQIDLNPVQWVNTNYIMDLVNIDTDEKWVYDFVENDESRDGQIFRRRRWVRQCIRDTEFLKEAKDLVMGAASSERLSKTLSTLLL